MFRESNSINIIIKYLKVHQYIDVLKQSATACFISEKEPMGLPQIYKNFCPKNMNMTIKKISQVNKECISEVSERFHMF
jgi:hypothetical protein